MWSDGPSQVDMLSYQPYADLTYEIAVSERMTPLTIGLFGSWGSGKSTLLNIINNKIIKEKDKNVVSIIINAWMFEGYDDAKTALMDSIVRTINENESVKENCKEGVSKLIKKIDWIRVGGALAKHGLPLVTSLIMGNPMPTIVSSIETLKGFNDDSITEIGEKFSKLKDFVKDKEDNQKESVIENIRTFREEFAKVIKDSGIDNLIIMIDDLDRCNPDRILETLEAVKLFLSVERTTFIIAIDEDVIRYSVKKKYPQLAQGEELDISKDYIEKIVQLPIKLPELSDIDIKNYMQLLICEMYLKNEKLKELINQLNDEGIFTKGEIISSQDINSKLGISKEKQTDFIKDGYKYEDYETQLNIFSRIADIISVTLRGNPRQAKRFLNTFYIRKKLSDIQKLNLNLEILAKLMVLEYVDINLFKQIYKWQFENNGLASELEEIEVAILKEEKLKPEYSGWDKDVVRRWVVTEPTRLHETDLRQYFYLARESVKDKGISMLNIGLEERRKINEICKKGLDSTMRKRKTKELLDLSPNIRNEIIKGIITKFKQEHAEYFEVLVNIYEFHPEYRDTIIQEFKRLRKGELTISHITLIVGLAVFNPEQIDKLKRYFIENKITGEKLWETVQK